MNKQWSGCLATSSLVLLAVTPAGAAEQGILWETSSQMEIAGSPMKMPPIKGEYCAKEAWVQPPESTDQTTKCKNTSFNNTGTKVTWQMVCENPPMTADGEITFNGSDSYTGIIKMVAEGMDMTVNLAGKKIGICDNPL